MVLLLQCSTCMDRGPSQTYHKGNDRSPAATASTKLQGLAVTCPKRQTRGSKHSLQSKLGCHLSIGDSQMQQRCGAPH